MSTVSVIASAGSSQESGGSRQEKITADLKALAVALAKNDKAGAQMAMKQLQIDSSGGSATSSSGSNASTDLAKVASALNVGNLPAAQSAFSTFESNAATAFNKGQAKLDDASDATSSGHQPSHLPPANTARLNVVV